MSEGRGVCVVAGVGPGNGTALAKKFAAEGYAVAMLARKEERLRALEKEIPGAVGYPVDVSEAAAVSDVIERVQSELGPIDILIHNAAAGAFNTFMDALPETLEMTFRTNMMSLMLLGQAVVPQMLERGGGSIIVTGNTSARRGKANFAAFAPTKAGQRIMAESMARSLGPQGIHVAYVIIDAVIDLPWTRKMHPDKPDDFFIQPADIADSVYHLTQQNRSAWTFELDLRPYAEPW